MAHASCRRDCVGLEIPWIGREDQAIDQSWHSKLLRKQMLFSSYAYAFLSLDFVLYEWLHSPAETMEYVRRELRCIPLLNVLLDECRAAARRSHNEAILKLLPQIRQFNRLRMQAIRLRLREDGLPIPRPQRPATPAAARDMLFPGCR